MLKCLVSILWFCCIASCNAQVLFSSPSSAAPAPAVAAGYNTLTLNSTFAPATVDTGNTLAPGFDWYKGNCCGGISVPNPISFNADGTAIINGSSGNFNLQLATATCVPPGCSFSGGWVGTAYGGGGYFEVTWKFDPSLVNTANGWPSFWANPVDEVQTWPGQAPRYVQYVELDAFELCQGACGGTVAGSSFVGSLHNWYGISGTTCTPGFCDVPGPISPATAQRPFGINWNLLHKVAVLWVPATASTNGSVTWYVDGVQSGQSQSWSQFTNQSAPPTTGTPWTFGQLDHQHMYLILGSGANQPVTVVSAKVWQKDASGNLIQ